MKKQAYVVYDSATGTEITYYNKAAANKEARKLALESGRTVLVCVPLAGMLLPITTLSPRVCPVPLTPPLSS